MKRYMQCPKCRHVQADRKKCEKCGVLVEPCQDYANEAVLEGIELAGRMADASNGMGRHLAQGFVAGLVCQHRTLQQRVGVIMVETLKHYASLKDGQYDARNEGLVKFARSIQQQIDDSYLPCI